MTTRQKTIEYVFQTNVATLTAATRRDFSTITVYIPESSPTFRSVEIEVTLGDDATAAQTLTSWLLGIKLGAVAFDDATVTDTITNSGEAQAYRFTREVSSYFTSNWSGTSMTCQVGVQFGGAVTQNHTAKLKITYDYDDTSTTHIKTIRVPIESTLGLLTTTMQTLGGTTAIPAFGGSYLPEASVVARQVWIELWGNEKTATAGDFIAQLRVNGGSSISWWDSESALISARWAYGIVDITAEDLTSARSLEAAVTTTTSRMGRVGGMVCITYEFNASTTTSVFNSLILGAYDGVGQVGGTTSSDAEAWGREIFIEEPGTITLKESGICLFGMDSVTLTLNVAVGSQGYTAYDNLGESTGFMAGQWSLVHRLDAGGQEGSDGITLARGLNSYILKMYTSTANRGWQISGFLILNYISDKSPSGAGSHSQSRYLSVGNTAADDPVRYFSSVAPSIPETDYWLTGAVVYSSIVMDNATSQGMAISVERGTSEGEGDGWEPLYIGIAIPDNENNNQTLWGAARSAWKRYPLDPDNSRMNVELSRRWKLDCALTGWAGVGFWYTYHTITSIISGSVTGSSGGTILISAYRTDNDELISSGSRTGDGDYTLTWYDNSIPVYVAAYESDSYVGRSGNFTASFLG